MAEELPQERANLIASLSSQVADGIGPLISELVEKKLKDHSKEKKPKLDVPPLSHPGLKAQAELLAKWIQEVEELDNAPNEETRKERSDNLKKSLKRRLTTVVGADSDSSIFHLADAYEKVESVIDQTDEFGKVVAEHLKKAASKPNEGKKKPRMEQQQPFRRSGYSMGTGVPAPSFVQFPPLPNPTHYAQNQQFVPIQFATSMPAYQPNAFLQQQQQQPFYGPPPIRGATRQYALQQRACYNCGQNGHIAASCSFAKKQ